MKKKKKQGAPLVNVALAPQNIETQKIILALRLDPYQSRSSRYPIKLTHPRTRKQAYLKDYAEDILGDSRLAIQTRESFVFVSIVTNSTA